MSRNKNCWKRGFFFSHEYVAGQKDLSVDLPDRPRRNANAQLVEFRLFDQSRRICFDGWMTKDMAESPSITDPIDEMQSYGAAAMWYRQPGSIAWQAV